MRHDNVLNTFARQTNQVMVMIQIGRFVALHTIDERYRRKHSLFTQKLQLAIHRRDVRPNVLTRKCDDDISGADRCACRERCFNNRHPRRSHAKARIFQCRQNCFYRTSCHRGILVQLSCISKRAGECAARAASCTLRAMSSRMHGTVAVVPSTQRIELFSDGVFAILLTLLIIEVEVPFLADHSLPTVLEGLMRTIPHFFSFAFSFFAISVFWVNHHHFFHALSRTDWVLLWHNIHLLFWLTLVPFTTAFLGEHPDIAIVGALYALNLCFAAGAFTLMARHAFFHGCFTNGETPEKERRQFVRRSAMGTGAYALAAVLAFGSVWVTWILLIAIPVYYVVPRIVGGDHQHR